MLATRLVRRLWRFCMIVSCVAAVVSVLRNESTAVLLFAVSGVAFFGLAEWRR